MVENPGLKPIAVLICDFMGWPEDGPAWDDAMKLAAQVHEPAYREGWRDREDDLIVGVSRIAPLSEKHGELSAENRALIEADFNVEALSYLFNSGYGPVLTRPLNAARDQGRAEGSRPSEVDREGVARIILGPKSVWNYASFGEDKLNDWAHNPDVARALAKADKILALLSRPSEGAADPDAVDRLARFAQGERMQDVWAGHYVPDMIRADLKLVLPPAAEDPAAQAEASADA